VTLPDQTSADFKKLASASKQYHEALGYPQDAEFDKISQTINKLGKEHNVLITYEVRELPSHGPVTAKPKSCACVCACACGI
jgi:hypothetical protein